jgi:hypothetical protein
MWGVALVGQLLDLLPGIGSVFFFGYGFPSVELAVIVLAALGIEDLLAGRVGRRPLTVLALVLLALIAVAAWHARQLELSLPAPGHARWADAAASWAVAGVALVVAAARVRGPLAARRRALLHARADPAPLVHLRCSRVSSVIRRELYFPGWSASLDGRAVALRPGQGIFQRVKVPAGSHTLSFAYAPPGEGWAAAALAAGVLWLLVATALRRGELLER